jgi:hypothetical protein
MNTAQEIQEFFEANKGWLWTEVAARKIGDWAVIYRAPLADGTWHTEIVKPAPCKEAAQWSVARLTLEQADKDPGYYTIRQLSWADHAN